MYPPEHGARKHLVHVVDIATHTDDGSMVVGAASPAPWQTGSPRTTAKVWCLLPK